MAPKYLLKLYVTGETATSQRAIRNLNKICKEDLKGEYQIIVIDLLKQPEMAENERIIATPMVIKELPRPLRRLIGDLSNREEVLLGLDLLPLNGTTVS